ncbi:Cohesin subunit rad21 [Spathaspora sp. JA1]|nr:Cohesin subunit rad21 [Spathaspora sp. JA1]
MLATTLTSKDGPLSHIWLAANYDRKLTKTQFLNTDIIQSTQLITNGEDTITLRASGQLLLGIVKIYSRKTKYLLDDAHDILYKLKSSFKIAKSDMVNLPVQNTMINLQTVTLPDQVGKFGLLYQDELNLDDDEEQVNIGGFFSQQPQQQHTMDYDQSVEFPRYEEENPMDMNRDDGGDDDFDFDLDVGMDDSVEIGRNITMGDDEREMSVLDIGSKDIFELDLGVPLQFEDPIIEEPEQEQEQAETPVVPVQAPPRIRRTGITDEGIITNKRKLIIDSQEDLAGISIQTLRDNQAALLSGNITVNLTQSEKLQLVYELSMPVCNKRRKLLDLNEELQARCAEIADLEEQQQREYEQEQYGDFNLPDDSIDFDLSLPDFNESEGEQPQQQPEEEILPEEYVVSGDSTIQIAEELRTLITKDQDSLTLNQLVENDLANKDKLPLGTINNKVNSKRQTTRCFFELLVLATNDCIELDQPQESNDILIRPRDRLYNQFF